MAQSDLCFQFACNDGTTFDVIRFELEEGLSRPFRLALELSSSDPNIGLELLDSEATFTIERDGEPVRTVHGIVTMFEQGETGFRRTRYRAVVEPALARLGLWHGSRIWQHLSVPDILRSRLKERGLAANVKALRSHETREYCVQHRETDLSYFTRLAAEEDQAGAEEIYVHAQKDQNIVVEHDETTRVGHDRGEDVGNDETIQIGHDRTETVGNDETLSIGQDRRETLGRDHVIDIGRSRQLTIAKDLIEDVGNVRIEKNASDRNAETGGHYSHGVEGRHDIEAGERITQRTRVVELHAGETMTLRGPGGTITLHDDGITIDAIEIRVKGPVECQPAGQGNVLSAFGDPKAPQEVVAASYPFSV